MPRFALLCLAAVVAAGCHTRTEVGVPTLDGLGAVGGGAHADHEWVDVETLPARVTLLHGILTRLL